MTHTVLEDIALVERLVADELILDLPELELVIDNLISIIESPYSNCFDLNLRSNVGRLLEQIGARNASVLPWIGKGSLRYLALRHGDADPYNPNCLEILIHLAVHSHKARFILNTIVGEDKAALHWACAS
jgi:hypothetical protein